MRGCGLSDEKKNGKWYIAILASLLGSAGGSGGTYFYLNTREPDQFRPDPFTGTQGRELEQRVRQLERDVAGLPPRDLTDRVLKLEERQGRMERDLDRHDEQHE